MLRTIIGIIVLFISINSFAQGEIQFLEDQFDFGEIPQTEGKVRHEFQFVNVGDEPVKITYVKASCGCTTPHWTRDMVAPGDTGVVVAEYNPFNRPGSFNKRLTINSNASNARLYLYIKGKVLPKPRSVETDYPTVIGNVRLKNHTINIGKITTEKTIQHGFEIYNDGDTVLTIDSLKTVTPAHITLNYSSTEVKPKGKASVIINYDPIKRDNLGYNSDNIQLATSDAEKPMKSITVMTTIEEYFPPMSPEELAKAPKLNINEKLVDFGKVNKGEQLTQTFELVNAGLQKLEIRKIDPNCSCLTLKKYKKKIAPGKSISLEVTLDTSDARGRQYKTLSIFTNDPSAPTQTIAIRAEVTQ